MVNHNQLKELAKIRLKEAKILHQNGCFDGSVYLCGYVIEMALKARICKLLKVNEYPIDVHKNAFKIHKFEQLLLLSGMSDVINATHQGLFTNWNLLIKWDPEDRYHPVGSVTEQYSEDLIKAIEDPQNGVLTWIKKRW